MFYELFFSDFLLTLLLTAWELNSSSWFLFHWDSCHIKVILKWQRSPDYFPWSILRVTSLEYLLGIFFFFSEWPFFFQELGLYCFKSDWCWGWRDAVWLRLNSPPPSHSLRKQTGETGKPAECTSLCATTELHSEADNASLF